MQFGAGPEFAAQCPRIEIPDGWRAWTDADGPMPAALSARARAAIENASLSLGATESFALPGVTALLRVEPRTWGRAATGELTQGCFREVGVYLPSGVTHVAPPAGPLDKLSKAATILTIVSLAVGTIATVSAWGKRK